jgi:hypothetical protein
MHAAFRRWILPAALYAFLAFATAARAQFAAPPGGYGPAVGTQAAAPPPAIQGYVPTTPQAPPPSYAPAPGTGYGYGYGYPGYYPAFQGPNAGTINATANLTTSTGQYYQQVQQAKLQQEDVRRSMIQTRQAAQEQADYEYRNRPTQGKMLSEERAARLERSRNNLPQTVIWSGDALNDLYENIKDVQTNYGVRGASVPLSADNLLRINVTAGTTPGSIGLYRVGRPLRWPLPLLDDRFKASRENIDKLAGTVVKSVVSGNTDNMALRDLLGAVGQLKDEVTAATKDQSPTDNIKSMRYANQLLEGAKSLTDPNAALFLNGTWAARGASVADMVTDMAMNGLKFAPATDGDEPFYTGLYRSILNYDASLMRLVQR